MNANRDLGWIGHDAIPEASRAKVRSILESDSTPDQKWKQLTSVLEPAWPHEFHQSCWNFTFQDDENLHSDSAPPMWIPDEAQAAKTPLGDWMTRRGDESVGDFHRWSVEQRSLFWQECIERLQIEFDRSPDEILEPDARPDDAKWLPGARLNIVNSCFHAPADQPAIIYSEQDGSIHTITYSELRQDVTIIASALRRHGFQVGDAIAVYLPMTPQSVVAYLGIIAAGCVAVSIADSFAPPEIQNRLRIANAKAAVTYRSINRLGKEIDLYGQIVEAGVDVAIVIDQHDQPILDLRESDIEWSSFYQSGNTELDQADFESFAPTSCSIDAPINVLFSSGTTGDPKAIPWDHSTPIKCAADAMLHQGVESGHVLAWPTNLGWMMGPWLIFAALLNRGTIALYHDAPVTRSFGKFVEQAKVSMLGVIPTIVRHWRQSKCMEGLNWSNIRCFSSTGESSQVEDMFYLSRLAGYRPVIEYCGGTEIGGGYISSTLVESNTPSTFTTPAFGLDVCILDPNATPSEEGELFLVPPSIGLSHRLLNRDHHDTYYRDTPNDSAGNPLRRHGDHFRRLANGLYAAGGRVDDTMNLGGIKVSSAEIERVLNKLESIQETAAVSFECQDGGISSLAVFVVPVDDTWSDAPDDTERNELLLKQCNQKLRQELNPLFRISRLIFVDSLPRTASNKVMRRVLRKMIDSTE